MPMNASIRDAFVPILIRQYLSNLSHFNGSQRLRFIFLLELLVNFLQRSLYLWDVGHAGVFLVLTYFEVPKNIFFDVLHLIIYER